MKKVMIVDDERIIRCGIASMIRWQNLGLELVGEAGSGQEGCELFERERPDIVLTDIRMPDMDGIEMVRRIKERAPQVKFVILSGYQDFSYAKEAIHLGVSEYLLKSDLMPEDIETILRRILAELEPDSAGMSEPVYERPSPDAEKMIFELCQGSRVLTEQDRERYPFLGTGYCCLCIGAKDDGDINSLIETVLQNCLAEFRYYVFQAGNLTRAVVFYEREAEPEVNERLQSCIVEAETHGHIITIGRSSHDAGTTPLGEMYERAFRSYNERVFYGCGNVIKITRANSELAGQQSTYQINRLEKLIEYQNRGEALNFMDDLFKRLKYRRNFDELHLVAMEILVTFNKVAGQVMKDDESFEWKRDTYQRFTKLELIDDIEAWFGERLLELMDRYAEHEAGGADNVIEYVKSYIEQHYMEEVSLQELSSKVCLNKNYLGQLFKKETGGSIGNYLTEVRIGKARELMEHSELKANVIAAEVGYEDERYFYKVFKKYTGVTTAEYMRKVRGG